MNGVVMLLPLGNEGQGFERSTTNGCSKVYAKEQGQIVDTVFSI
jgi:hypothetical protein